MSRLSIDLLALVGVFAALSLYEFFRLRYHRQMAAERRAEEKRRAETFRLWLAITHDNQPGGGENRFAVASHRPVGTANVREADVAERKEL